MKEIIDIVAAYDGAVKQGKKTALATVVLEGDALRKARLVILQQEPMLVTYDTTDDDDAKLGVGLGCNGIIHILIEPISDHSQNPIKLLKAILNNRSHAVLVTLFSVDDRKAPQPGTCLCLTETGLIEKGLEYSNYKQILTNDAKRVLENHRSETSIYTDKIAYTAFIEHIKPVVSLVIIGAGNDAIPLTKIAAVLGWDITVVDGRHNYALPERFPLAKKIIVAKPEQVLSQLKLNEWTAFVLMTHNYIYELNLLKELLPLSLSYIGVLGPKKKLERMLNELENNGVTITEEQRAHVYGPVGLDIGSEGAEEIALSIVAEIKAVLSLRKGYSLKYKPVPIHSSQLIYPE
jgi:xanthine dehydrogenase accessory factor